MYSNVKVSIYDASIEKSVCVSKGTIMIQIISDLEYPYSHDGHLLWGDSCNLVLLRSKAARMKFKAFMYIHILC